MNCGMKLEENICALISSEMRLRPSINYIAFWHKIIAFLKLTIIPTRRTIKPVRRPYHLPENVLSSWDIDNDLGPVV